jgi:hypothetical protein
MKTHFGIIQGTREGASLSQVIEIFKKRTFHLEDAQQLLPVILRMTEVSNVKVRTLLQKLEVVADRNSVQAQEIETEIDLVISQWQQKVEKLGANAKGLWLVDFDNGEGYFCWKFPETKIMFFHGYQDGFSGRKIIEAPEEKLNNEQM